MPTLEINGRDVEVDDSFLRMTPEQQNATVDEIAMNLGGEQPEQPLGPAAQDFASQASQITRDFGQGNKLGTARSFSENFADTATFGLADQAAAGIGSLGAMLPGGHGKDYDSLLREIRAQKTQNDAAHPIAKGTGMVAGAVGSGLGLAKGGLSLTGRLGADAGLGMKMLAGAGDGALWGGAYGFGSGEGASDRIADAAGGAVMGGLTGGAIPAVVSTVRTVAKPIVDAVKARTNPSGYASQKVAERLSASGLTPETIANKMAANPGSAVADVSGKSARDLLRTTVNIPGPAKDRVSKQVVMRQFGQGDRLKTAIGRTFADPDGYLNAKDELADAAKKLATPLYERAYARPVHFSGALEDVLNTPAGKQALAKAQALAANEQQPFKQVFVNIRGEARRVPDTRGWDYIKRSLDDMIEGQKDPISRKMTNEGRILVGLKDRMLKEIDSFNPDYKAARGVFSGIAQVDDAMEFGRKAMTMSPHAVRREIAAMSASQKEAARIGAAEELRKAIDGTGWTNNAVLKVFGNRQRLQNLRALFDNDDQFREFRKVIFQEARKRSTYEAVRGNSTTASQLADMAETGGLSETTDFLARSATQGPISATLQWVGSRLRMLGGLTPKVADEISKRLMSTSPAQTRELVSEMARIEAAKISGAQKSQMIQALVSRALTAPTVGAISGSH